MNLHNKNIGRQSATAPLIAITGALGYVGRQLSKSLTEKGFRIRGLTRSVPSAVDTGGQGVDLVSVDYFDRKCLDIALKDCDIVIHLAGIAHTRKHASDESVYRRAILDVTKNVYEAAQRQGCKKFIFASSINVYGKTSGTNILNETSECRPIGYYGKYKLQSEEYLRQASSKSSTSAISVRLPPIYGGKTANSLKYLFWAAAHKIPLPISNLDNVRSILSIENLTRFMIGICNGELSEELYVLHDMSSLTVSQIYRHLWQLHNNSDFPAWPWLRFPEILKAIAISKGPLAPLFLTFHIESNFTGDFLKLGINEARTSLKIAVDDEKKRSRV
jgi:nucleoside-diphosphate-sugar epimerase